MDDEQQPKPSRVERFRQLKRTLQPKNPNEGMANQDPARKFLDEYRGSFDNPSIHQQLEQITDTKPAPEELDAIYEQMQIREDQSNNDRDLIRNFRPLMMQNVINNKK